jgi:hypothetical protein
VEDQKGKPLVSHSHAYTCSQTFPMTRVQLEKTINTKLCEHGTFGFLKINSHTSHRLDSHSSVRLVEAHTTAKCIVFAALIPNVKQCNALKGRCVGRAQCSES